MLRETLEDGTNGGHSNPNLQSQCSHHQLENDSELSATGSGQDSTAKKTSEISIRVSSSSSTKSSFYPVTMELRPDTLQDFLLAAEETSKGEFKSEQPFCLVGLHTCGDLCSTALRLFAGNPRARALSVVGCCYHHITEKDDGDGEIIEGLYRGARKCRHDHSY